ncbi:MAG: winged helix DNA-binding domain-containing protein [Candidatus Dormiibacterota bacterium]
MKSQLPAAELSWPQVHAFRLRRHHLATRAPAKDLVRIAGEIGGAQAQVMSSAELQLGVRWKGTVEDVKKALWKDKVLVKTWLMRGTLHLVPSADLPLYTAAMRSRWVWPNNTWLKWVQLTEPELISLITGIGDALDEPMTREELIAKMGRSSSEHVRTVLKSGWSTLLKPVARAGRLCFGPSRGTSVTFVRPDVWLRSWRDIDPDEAVVEVGRRYLRAYGPATKDDFGRWFGAWPGVGKAAWTGLADELVPVSIEGRRADVLAPDLKELKGMAQASSVRLLPTFDPYLMGHNSRDHLFEPMHRAKVSRTAGWISAVVLVDGRVVGTWTHTVARQTLRIVVDPFHKLQPAVRTEIGSRCDEIASSLGAAEVEISYA